MAVPQHDRLAALLLGYAHRPDEPPDLMQLAARVGADVQQLDRPGVEGETRWHGGTPVIYVPFTHPRSGRERFTLAHELAHVAVALAASSDPGIAGLHQRGGASLERLCDRVASATLMPTMWVEAHVPARVGLADVVRARRAASVSLSAAAVRLRMLGRDLVLIRWAHISGLEWRVASAVGVPRSRWQAMRLHDTESSDAYRFALDCADSRAHVPWEVARRGRTVTTFVGASVAGPVRRFTGAAARGASRDRNSAETGGDVSTILERLAER